MVLVEFRIGLAWLILVSIGLDVLVWMDWVILFWIGLGDFGMG